MDGLFAGCHSLRKINLSSFNMSNVLSMTCLFYDCILLTEIDLSNF